MDTKRLEINPAGHYASLRHGLASLSERDVVSGRKVAGEDYDLAMPRSTPEEPVQKRHWKDGHPRTTEPITFEFYPERRTLTTATALLPQHHDPGQLTAAI